MPKADLKQGFYKFVTTLMGKIQPASAAAETLSVNIN
jgi:hypothetical protein